MQVHDGAGKMWALLKLTGEGCFPILPPQPLWEHHGSPPSRSSVLGLPRASFHP